MRRVAELLAGRAVGIGGCLLSMADAHTFVTRHSPVRYERIFIEPLEEDPARAVAAAGEMNSVLDHAQNTLERVSHGVGPATWNVLRWAAAQGHGLRAGLEDTDRLPDRTRAASNAELVHAAAGIRRTAAG